MISLSVTNQTDGNPVATVKLASQVDAQHLISHLHHIRFGHKRLQISYVQNNLMDPAQLREIVITLLQVR